MLAALPEDPVAFSAGGALPAVHNLPPTRMHTGKIPIHMEINTIKLKK